MNFANIINIRENKMIIPELTNSNLNKKKFIIELNKLLTNDKLNLNQINSINNSLKKIVLNEPPFEIAAKRIITYFFHNH